MVKRLAIALALLLATLLVLLLYLPEMRPQPPVSMASGAVAIGGPFTLVDAKGETVTDANLKGRYSLIYFGFTNCPDICPLALQTMTQALEAAGPAADGVQPVFISVDPERDTADALAGYIANFHPRFLALTGTVEQAREAAKSYKVYAAKAPVKDADGKETGDYTVNHTGYIYLMDRDGKYLAHFPSEAKADEITAAIRQLPHG